MEWHIISIGDEAFLFKIFQFLSLIGSTNLYTQLGLLGALVGLLLVIVQTVTSQGRQMPLGALLIGVCLFSALFGTTTQVELEDFHTGRTDFVSGVPVGTALMGTIVSQGGVALINLFQQGTAVPGHETLAPDYALTTLAASRSLTDSDLCAANSAACPFVATLSTYMTDCVYPAYKGMGRNGAKGWWSGDPQTATDALAAMRVDNQFTMTSDLLRTKPYGTQTDQSCSQTYEDLVTASKDGTINDALASTVLAASHTEIPPNAPPGTATQLAVQKLGSSYLSLQDGDTSSSMSQSGTIAALAAAQQNAQQMMVNATVMHAMTNSSIRGAVGPADMANAAMVESASQRRNVTYAAEQSMFSRNINATMTFFEGISYGLAPFMAFLVPMGSAGSKFLGKYLQLLLWIFLWLPLMSIVNLFEIMSVLRQMNALAPSRGNGPLTSMVGIIQVQYSVGDWIAMGGWLTTSVVGLSGMIVFGSVAAFQQIASAAHGPDNVESSGLAPEMMQTAPMMQTSSQFSQSGGGGLARSNAGDISLSAASGYQSALSIRHSQIVSNLRSLGMSESDANSATYQSALQWAHSQGATDSSRAGITEGAGTSAGHSSSTNDALQHSAQTAKNASSTASVDAGAGVNIGIAKIGASVSASTGISHGVQNSQQVSHTEGSDASTKEDSSVQRAHDRSSADSSTSSQSEGTVTSSSHSAQWNDTLNKSLSDLKSYDSALAQQASFNADAKVDGRQIAAALPANGEAFANVQNAVQGLGGGEYYHQMYDQLEQNFPNAQERAAVAGMATLQHLSQAGGSDAIRMEATRSLVEGMEATNPLVKSTLQSAATGFLSESASIGGVQEATGGVASRVDSGVHHAPPSHSHAGGGTRSSVETAVGGAGTSQEELYKAGEHAVRHDANQNLGAEHSAREAAGSGSQSLFTSVGEVNQQ